MRLWGSRSSRPARASKRATIPSAPPPRTWWATCARARTSTPRTRRWWSTIRTASFRATSMPELVSLVRYRHQPGNPDIARHSGARPQRAAHAGYPAATSRPRDPASGAWQTADKGALVVMDAASGDVLALVSAPAPDPPGAALRRAHAGRTARPRALRPVSAGIDLQAGYRHRRPAPEPGVGAPHLSLPDAARWARGQHDTRAGTGPSKTISATAPTERSDMQRAIAVSCNAYFAQLGVHDVGSKALAETAARMGICHRRYGANCARRCRSRLTGRGRC